MQSAMPNHLSPKSHTGPIRLLTSQAEHALLRSALLMALCAPPTLALAIFDPRMLDGANVWFKPLKFQISLAVFFATLACMMPLTSKAFRSGKLGKATTWLAVSTGIFEVAWITLQAARGERSHYNETPFGSFMYAAMGIGAVLLSITPVSIAIATLRNKSLLPPLSLLRWGACMGILASLLGTIIVGGMLGDQPNHYPTPEQPRESKVPFVGWSTTDGDLRIAHFVGMHAMQAIFIFSIALSYTKLPSRLSKTLTTAAAVAWILMTILLITLAIQDQSPLQALSFTSQ